MTISKIKYFLSLLAIAVLFSACSDDDDPTIVIPEEIPAEIAIDAPGLHPSKFDFDHSRDLFVVGSVAFSNVGHIDPMTGEYTVFITDDNFSTIPEVFVDESRNRILVTSGDLGVSANSMNLFSYAYFGAYDLDTGNKITGIDFRSLHPDPDRSMMANGMAVADNGDIYVADNFAPVIYKIDGQTYEASILVEDPLFTAPTPNPGLFGIILAGDNLILSKQDDGLMFKVPLSDPTNVTIIDAPTYVGAKGLERLSGRNVALSIGGSSAPFSGVITLQFNDDWTEANPISFFESLPTEKHPIATTIANDGQLYLMNSYFPQIFSGNPSEIFSIVRVE